MAERLAPPALFRRLIGLRRDNVGRRSSRRFAGRRFGLAPACAGGGFGRLDFDRRRRRRLGMERGVFRGGLAWAAFELAHPGAVLRRSFRKTVRRSLRGVGAPVVTAPAAASATAAAARSVAALAFAVGALLAAFFITDAARLFVAEIDGHRWTPPVSSGLLDGTFRGQLIEAGEIFGEIALLDGSARSADATANTNCELFTIDRREFIPFVRSQPGLAMKFIELLCARIRWTSDQVEQVILQNLPGRLASALLRLSEKHKSDPQGRTIAITQQEISEMVGMTRESINKQLRVWAGRNWVRLEHGAIVVLNAEMLRELVEAGSGSGDE